MRQGSQLFGTRRIRFVLQGAPVFTFKIELKEHILEKLGHNNDMF